jgi:hypothetical protein
MLWRNGIFLLPEQICWQALNGEMDIFDAADALANPDCYAGVELSHEYPKAKVLEEMLCELAQHPQEREAIMNKYKVPAMKAFYQVLEILTSPPIADEEPPKQHPIPRSASQDLC